MLGFYLCSMTKLKEHSREICYLFLPRYKNILPFDHTRVVLRGMGEKPGDDYINANYIHHEEESLGCGNKPYKQYIATQGCVGGTRGDFYHMIWQEKSLLVVMTTKVMERGKTKCARYWPEVEQTEEYGGYTVTNLSEETSKDYTLREFSVSKGDETRRIFHYHFLGWPDHGTPEDPGSVLNFLHDVNIKQESLGKSFNSDTNLNLRTMNFILILVTSFPQKGPAQSWFTVLRELEELEPSLS